MKLTFIVLDDGFTIHRFPPDRPVPPRVWDGPFCAVSRTEEELSVVCRSALSLDSEKAEPGWSCLKVAGPLDFSLTGILAEISAVLADAEISIFAVSTFDTDYVLVKSDQLALAESALTTAGHTIS